MGSKKRRLVTIDCETDPFLFGRPPEPFIWGSYDGIQYRQFDTVEELLDYWTKRNVVIYAHNGGRFDFVFLRHKLEPWSQIRLVNGRMAAFKIGNAIFRDSYLILPTPLKSYKKEEFDYALMEKGVRDQPEVRAKICHYLEKDCVYLHELVSKFRDTYGGALTLASSGLAFFRKQSGVEIPKTSSLFYSTFKPFYHGGRVQVFRPGVHEGLINAYDMNSQYPTAMMTWHPWGEKCEVYTGILPPPDELERSFITLEAESTGAFCFSDGKTMEFPADGKEREFNVTGWEYIAAKETGTLKGVKVIRSYVFVDKIRFKDYVEYFYEIKKNAPDKSAERLFAKLFMNSLYGKFAANPEKYRNYIVVPTKYYPEVEDGRCGEKYEGYKFEEKISPDLVLMSKPLEEEQQRFYNIATAASITGWARASLWRALCSAKKPFYCDTDSVIAEGFDGKVGKGLGEWKHEFTATTGAFAGKKLYALTDGTPWGRFDDQGEPIGWKLATKGVNPKEFTGPNVFRVARGEKIKHYKAAPSMSLKGGVKFIDREVKRTA